MAGKNYSWGKIFNITKIVNCISFHLTSSNDYYSTIMTKSYSVSLLKSLLLKY